MEEFNDSMRLLKEAVYFCVKENLTNDILGQRVSIEHVTEPGVHRIFAGRTIEATALLYKFISKRIKRVPRQTILLDPFLFEINETLNNVVNSETFGFDFHKIVKNSSNRDNIDSFSEQSIKAYQAIQEDTNKLLKTKMDHIIDLVGKRDNEILSHLNNSMNLTDTDIITEVTINVEFFNEKIKQETHKLIEEVKRNSGVSFVNETEDFWNSLIQSKVTDKI